MVLQLWCNGCQNTNTSFYGTTFVVSLCHNTNMELVKNNLMYCFERNKTILYTQKMCFVWFQKWHWGALNMWKLGVMILHSWLENQKGSWGEVVWGMLGACKTRKWYRVRLCGACWVHAKPEGFWGDWVTDWLHATSGALRDLAPGWCVGQEEHLSMESIQRPPKGFKTLCEWHVMKLFLQAFQLASVTHAPNPNSARQ